MRTALIATVAILLSATGCSFTDAGGQTEGHREVGQSDHYHAVVLRPDDPLAEASLQELADAADLVFRGEVTSEGPGATFGTGSGALAYTRLTVTPSEFLKGSAAGDIPVLALTKTPDGRPVEVEGRPQIVRTESIWFVSRVDPSFSLPTDYVLTSLGGVIPAVEGDVTESSVDTAAVEEAEDLGTLDRVAEEIVGPS